LGLQVLDVNEMPLAAEDGQDDPQHPDRAQLDEAVRNQSVSEKQGQGVSLQNFLKNVLSQVLKILR
jgi:hypothetical protein